ncbi:TraV family lipoprotein (plasmid) [Xanthomonas citri pv. citri]|uniref:TraV family lipoprotein n=1 Tax=Xanthomonas citri TaxID=346 RepID=UPI0019349E8E|nr:TraV family lipoprotein [Xanthomonas citri]QRD62630.1 TraV family lipoprotein [Xanthomonas citri pv. citri]QRD67165.1 TraV family lipoprotein [Xanthomonas citri pv. citri]QRD71790.1 TraV family lipoprotein [Xanthomonas citri pv. citri]
MLTQILIPRAWRLLAAAGAILALSGCSSIGHNKFACPAPDGFTCMNPVEVYEATNDINSVDEIGKSNAKNGKKMRRAETGPTAIIVPAAASVAAPPPVAVGPDRCCKPVLAGIKVGRNDSLSLAAPSAPIASTQVSADAVNRLAPAQRAEVPLGDAYREAAKIMRIYVAPWLDEEGDLHMGGHIYTEVEPRKWRVGQAIEVDSQNNFSLLKGQVAAQSDEVASGQSNQGTTPNGFTNPQL